MIRNTSRNRIIVAEFIRADSLFRKALGLMFVSKSKSMLFNFNIENNRSFHTMFMRFNLDFLFLDSKKRVVKIVKDAKPWRLNISGIAKYVIELPSGKSLNTQIGDVISFK